MLAFFFLFFLFFYLLVLYFERLSPERSICAQSRRICLSVAYLSFALFVVSLWAEEEAYLPEQVATATACLARYSKIVSFCHRTRKKTSPSSRAIQSRIKNYLISCFLLILSTFILSFFSFSFFRHSLPDFRRV
jgi:hypothetical protein